MTPSAAPFWGWPGWHHLGLTLLLALGLNLWWVLIYGGANCLTDLHSHRVRLCFDAELSVPFIPVALIGYMSIYPLLWSAPFILRARRELVGFAVTVAAATLAAGVCFLLFPADALFPTPQDAGAWNGPIRFAKDLALQHNMAPSLHVAFCVICVTVYARRTPRWGAALLWGWALAVGASTIFLHQHYLIDVATGFLAGWAAVRLVYDRWQPSVLNG